MINIRIVVFFVLVGVFSISIISAGTPFIIINSHNISQLVDDVGYVPYAGATQNVDIGSYNFTAGYLFGDGQYLTGIQHGALTLFLHNETSSVSGSRVLDTAANDTGMVTLSVDITVDGQEFQNWTTDEGVPGLPLLSDGIYEFHFHARVTGAGTKDATFQAEIYKVNATGGDSTLIITTEESTILTTDFIQEDIHVFGDEVAFGLTDRILLRIIVRLRGTGSNPTVEMQIENGVEGRLEVPSPSPTKELFIPYVGAVRNIDLGSWNVTASYVNVTGGILLENDATISRSGTDTKTWLSESGNWITQFGA